MKGYGCLTLIFLSFCLLVPSIAFREAFGELTKEISGRVLDENGAPLQNVTVAFWQVEEVRESPPLWVQETWMPPLHVNGSLETTVITDANGFFNATLNPTLSWSFGYRLYVYAEDFRYMPLVRYYRDLSKVPEDLSFQLTPAASFFLNGEVLIVNSATPWKSLYPLIFDVNPVPEGDVHTYCDPADSYFGEAHSFFLGLEPRQVIVPANTSVEIKVSGFTGYRKERIVSWQPIYRLVPICISFYIDQLPIQEPGQVFQIDIREYSLQYNSLIVQNLLQEVEDLLDQAERKGFYAPAEKRDLEESKSLLISAESNRIDGFYDDSYADILQAYQIGSELSQRINDMYLNANVSAVFFPLFFAFTAVAVASLVFESEKLKALMTLTVYIFLLVSFYHLYPGSSIVNLFLLIESSIGFISAVLILSLVVPRLVKETAVKGRIAFRSAIVALFSLAKRNMKRRRLRSISTLAVVTISIAAFVALTSFSIEYGLMVIKTSRSPPAEGLLVRAADTLSAAYRETIPFAPMGELDVAWLSARDRAVSVAPRSENPRKRVIQSINESGRREYYDPLGTFTLSQNEKMFFSVIGIVPSAEASATHLDSIVKMGRYLDDNETNAILLSEKAANELGAHIGDQLLWIAQLEPLAMSTEGAFSVKLVGILEDSSLDNLRDLDGQRFLPQKILEKQVASSVLGGIQVTKSLIDCSSDEVVIATYQSAYNFSDSVYLSRVNVLVDDPQNVLPFARELVLMRNVKIWASIGESLYLYELGSYADIGGSGIIIALIIAMLTVGTTMSASVYERKDEMNVLSAVGLNPSHITMLFVDQAIIIGLIGGAIGYLLGTGLYQVFILVPTDIMVRQKLSLGWSLVALAVGMAATTLGTAIPALKASILVTPSLLRRWKIEKKPSSAEEPYIFEIPVKVRREDIDDFVTYLRSRLLDYREGDLFSIKRIRLIHKKTPEEFTNHIRFTYFYPLQIWSFVATNDIAVILKKNEDVCTVRLASRGAGPDEEKHLRKIAGLIRNFALEWSSEKSSRH